MMLAFIVRKAPKSHNSDRRQKYQDEIAATFDSYRFAGIPLTGKLYARVYYFHNLNRPTDRDADNLSKPIIDALKHHAYDDDKRVVHRTAAILNMANTNITELSLTDVPESIFTDFLDALDNEPHVLYIELGVYKHGMLQFGGEE